MKADDTVRVVVKGFLRCLYFGRLFFFGFRLPCDSYVQVFFFKFACENINEYMPYLLMILLCFNA